MRAPLVALCLVALAGPARGRERPPGPPPIIDLYTMGPGDDLFSAFGHAAICVTDGGAPAGRCYNYGTADFDTPGPLTWSFVRGRARFWVSVVDEPTMLRFYRSEDRSLWRQRLALEPGRARRLAEALAASTDERVKYYRYHHFDDNCTTRIRDLLDAATDGALRRDSAAPGPTFRDRAREGFAGRWSLLAAIDLLLGHVADRRTDRWSALFLPSELRAAVAERMGAPPELLYQRAAPLESGSPHLGAVVFAALGLLLALLLAAGARLGHRPLRAALLVAGLVLGLVGLLLWGLAVLSTFPELTRNELLAAFWPTDLALGLLAPRALGRYASVRLAALALLVLGHLVGLTQPLAPLALAALPLASALTTARRARVVEGP